MPMKAVPVLTVCLARLPLLPTEDLLAIYPQIHSLLYLSEGPQMETYCPY